jgi:hypothetical protein
MAHRIEELEPEVESAWAILERLEDRDVHGEVTRDPLAVRIADVVTVDVLD